MADGFAPAIDKVGPPAPRAPEAQASAPSFGAPPFKPAASNPLAPQTNLPSFSRNDAPVDRAAERPAGHVDHARENKPSGLPSIFGGPKPDAPQERKPNEGVSIGGPKPDLPPKPSGGLSSLFGAPKADAPQEKKPNEGLPSIFGAPKADAMPEKKLDNGPGVHLHPEPKPVEVSTAPDTPMNGATPPGASPRPELKIAQEPTSVPDESNGPLKLTDPDPPKPAAIPSLSAHKEKTPEPPKPAADPLILTGRDEPKPSAAPAIPKERAPEPLKKAEPLMAPAPNNVFKPSPPPATHAGPAAASVPAPAPAPAPAPVAAPPPQAESVDPKPTEPAPSLGDKRKHEDSSPVVPATVKPLTDDKAMPDAKPLEKKPKLDEPSAPAPAPALDTAPAAPAAEPPKPQPKPRAKKEKKAPAVGRTQRKTRSQGPADVDI